MAKIYYNLIISGTINPKTGRPYTINDVPVRYQEAVRKLLEENPGD